MPSQTCVGKKNISNWFHEENLAAILNFLLFNILVHCNLMSPQFVACLQDIAFSSTAFFASWRLQWVGSKQYELEKNGITLCRAVRYKGIRERPFGRASHKICRKHSLVCLERSDVLPDKLPSSQRKTARVPRVCDVLERPECEKPCQMHSGGRVGSHCDGWQSLCSCKSEPNCVTLEDGRGGTWMKQQSSVGVLSESKVRWWKRSIECSETENPKQPFDLAQVLPGDVASPHLSLFFMSILEASRRKKAACVFEVCCLEPRLWIRFHLAQSIWNQTCETFASPNCKPHRIALFQFALILGQSVASNQCANAAYGPDSEFLPIR